MGAAFSKTVPAKDSRLPTVLEAKELLVSAAEMYRVQVIDNLQKGFMKAVLEHGSFHLTKKTSNDLTMCWSFALDTSSVYLLFQEAKAVSIALEHLIQRGYRANSITMAPLRPTDKPDALAVQVHLHAAVAGPSAPPASPTESKKKKKTRTKTSKNKTTSDEPPVVMAEPHEATLLSQTAACKRVADISSAVLDQMRKVLADSTIIASSADSVSFANRIKSYSKDGSVYLHFNESTSANMALHCLAQETSYKSFLVASGDAPLGTLLATMNHVVRVTP